jgi:hypothetical protein
VDLNPFGYHGSCAYGVSDGQQVGFAISFAGYWSAGLWYGTAASYVNLNPGVIQSEAFGVSDGQQVGWADIGGDAHASLWSGTAASWVDLNPAESTYSVAYGVCDGQQVGYALIASQTHAGLWSGTAESWLDLSPAGSTQSKAGGVSNGRQVGYANIGGYDHAGLWSGTADSWMDLHKFLPANYISSQARGIEVSGNDVWVAGYAHNNTLNRDEAILWHNVIPEPSSLLALGTGLLALGGMIRRQGRMANG